MTVGRTRAKTGSRRTRRRPQILAGAGARRCRFRRAGRRGRDLESVRFERLQRGRHGAHIIANNLLGFTTLYSEEHSSRFSAQLARRQSIPIFHVNAEDVDAVVRVGRLALDYRYTWAGDVVVDLIGYRRHGHSDVDDPTVTQPLLYKAIKDHPPLWEIYAEDIGAENVQQKVEKVREELEAAQKKAKTIRKKPLLRELPRYWNDYKGGRYKPEYEVDTGLCAEELGEITTRLTTYPADFHIHPKVKKLLEQRAEMGAGKRLADYGMAEALALGGLVKAGVPVRLTGQDTRRGTFNQRHSVLVDIENEQEYVPLENITEGQARCEIYNSALSEAGVLGFEYGYSRDYPETLVMWEAQFGDFPNVAQAVIDQFVSAGEDKWDPPRESCCSCRMRTRGRGRAPRALASNASCNSRPETISRSASRRMPCNIFTCCGARRCATGASRSSSSRPRVCVAPSRCVISD